MIGHGGRLAYAFGAQRVAEAVDESCCFRGTLGT